MRIALLADLHANREAVEACLKAVRKAGCDRIVLLGDIVGYGADPAWTVDMARALVEDGALAVFECFNRSQYEEGDHVIFVGEVERCQHRADASPLLFHGGKFYAEHPL